MGFAGSLMGWFLGRNGGLLCGIICAVLGHSLEEKLRALFAQRVSGDPGDSYFSEAGNQELALLAALSAMLAKIAKADGHITREEILYCESWFSRFGLDAEKRRFCIKIFRKAKDDEHTLHEYATSYAAVQRDESMREVVYDILWDMAAADRVVSPEELSLLASVTSALRINPALFAWQCTRRRIRRAERRSQTEEPSSALDPYEVLGCRRTDSDEVVKKAFREKAKSLHPDILRGKGLSEELIKKASDQMARVNEAWSEIRKERGL
ncbi:MAG: TerB family tellurite resistance protein [Kiritimatiellae bacterium]|nr:TerB family tellurite resistance protein [Kiritimatiellia bacterium]